MTKQDHTLKFGIAWSTLHGDGRKAMRELQGLRK